jgi:hypothetical protein
MLALERVEDYFTFPFAHAFIENLVNRSCANRSLIFLNKVVDIYENENAHKKK